MSSYNWEPGISKLPTSSISFNYPLSKAATKTCIPLSTPTIFCYLLPNFTSDIVSYTWERCGGKKEEKGIRHGKETIGGCPEGAQLVGFVSHFCKGTWDNRECQE